VQLLLGNVDRLAEFSDTWYELLVSRLVYSKPQMMKVRRSFFVACCRGSSV
jgi:hypothetical protein